MNIATQKADILIEAVKHIKQFEGKIIVIKYGGNAMEDKKLKASVFEDISVLSRLGMQIVVVHGGGPKIDAELAKQGIKKKVIEGLRVTDDTTLEVVKKALKEVNRECVAGLKKIGIRAQDCTPGTLHTKVRDKRLGHVGDIVQVDAISLLRTLAYGVIPVVSSLGEDDAGQAHNINADTAATKIAEALQAEKLTILTNIDGVLDSVGQRVSHLSSDEAEQYIKDGVIEGGMIPKVRACAHAASHGVEKAHLLNGTIPRALLLEIYTDEGIGTEIVK